MPLVASSSRPLRLLALLGCLSEASPLGPGAGPWAARTPEEVGLSEPLLAQAARGTFEDVPGRSCFAVFRGGALVHEEYYGGTTPSSLIEGDSAMKSFSALVMGVAWTKGLFDLDAPLASYGVEPLGDFAKEPGKTVYFPMLTARHVLGQVSGFGLVPPGTEFTYDSAEIVQHLERLLRIVAKTQDTVQWATEHLAVPLGIPDLFTADGDEWTVGGGQLITCRDMARLGQLMLNRGRWLLAGTDEPFQLIAEEYMDMMTSPSFPAVGESYGFFTWLSLPNRANEAAPTCCYPRWGFGDGCTFSDQFIQPAPIKRGNYHVFDPNGTLLSDDLFPGFGLEAGVGPVYIALGYLTKVLVVLPAFDLSIVSFGNTWTGSSLCDMRYNKDNGDQDYPISLMWKHLRPSLLPMASNRSELGTARAVKGAVGSSSSAKRPIMALERKSPSRHSRTRTKARTSITDLSAVQKSPHGSDFGSCACTCSPDQGFGSCFVVPRTAAADANTCAAFETKAAAGCPPVGVLQECKVPDLAALLAQGRGSEADVLDPCSSAHEFQQYFNLTCETWKSCASGSTFATCSCIVTAVSCTYDDAPCNPDDAYMTFVNETTQDKFAEAVPSPAQGPVVYTATAAAALGAAAAAAVAVRNRCRRTGTLDEYLAL